MNKELVKHLELELSRLRRKRRELNEEIESAREKLREADPGNWEFGEDPGY